MRSDVVALAVVALAVAVAADDRGFFCCDIEHPPFCMEVPDASPCPWSATTPFRDETVRRWTPSPPARAVSRPSQVCENACFSAAAAAPPRRYCRSHVDTAAAVCFQSCANATFSVNETVPGACPEPFRDVRFTVDYEQCDDGRSKNMDCQPPAALVDVVFTELGADATPRAGRP